MKLKNFFYTILTLLFMASWVYMLSPHQPVEATAPLLPAQKAAIDPRLVQLGGELGISEDMLRLANARVEVTQQTSDANGKIESAFDSNTNTIYIFPEVFTYDRPRQRSILAHEFLHWAWNTQSPDKTQLCAQLQVLYQRPSLQHRMQPYMGTTQDVFCDELDSIVGSEMNDASLSPGLKVWYTKWVPNRNALPSYF